MSCSQEKQANDVLVGICLQLQESNDYDCRKRKDLEEVFMNDIAFTISLRIMTTRYIFYGV